MNVENYPRYDSVESFYSANEDRRRSPELDFGVMWVASSGRRFPNWRISHVRDTSEMYAVRLSSPDTVLLLADHIDEDDAELAMRGWADGEHKTLGWACGRLAEWMPDKPQSEAPIFESSTSPLSMSNDGRVRIATDPDRRKKMTWAIEVDGREAWRTQDRRLADAFIAGWDERSRSVLAEIALAQEEE